MSELIQRLECEAEGLRVSLATNEHLRALLSGTISRPAYIYAVLCQIYHYTRETSAWLSRCSERLRAQGKYSVVADHLARKASEEEGHEEWALSDCMALGVDRDVVDYVPWSSAVSAYVLHNRMTSEEGSPLAILGTSFVLEYISVHSACQVVASLRKRSTIHRIERATKFLRRHAAADVGHLEGLRTLLGAVEDPSDQDAILVSTRLSSALFPLFFRADRRWLTG